jgi:hypothetical protein
MYALKQLAAAIVLGTLTAASLGGCLGGPSSPTAPSTVNVTHSPAVGATVANGASYEVRVDDSGARGRYFATIAFVRDDGVYSRPFLCGETDAGSGGGSGGRGAGLTHDVRNPVDTLNFAVGRRVNLVVLFSSRGPCVIGLDAPAADPSQADLGRKDVTLNWLVGG